jgi:hypothetical protein
MNITLAAKPSPSRAAMLGLLLAAPAGLFLLANVLNELGIGLLYAPIDALISGPQWQQIFNLVSPVVFLGGIAAALLLNFLAIVQLDLRWEQKRLVSTVTIEPRTLNVVLILAVGLMLTMLVAYAFVENFAIIRTHI